MSHSKTRAALCALLDTPPTGGVTLVALTGAPGSDASALARAIGARPPASFSGGALYLHGGPHALRASLVLEAERHCGVDPAGDTDLMRRAARVRRTLASRGRILAVIDDAQESHAATWAVDHLLPSGSAALLVTRDRALLRALPATEVALPAGEGTAQGTRAPETLPRELQWRLARLCAFAAGVLDAHVVAAVWDDDADAARAGLAALAHEGLLAREGDPAAPRYRLEPDAAAEAAALLEASPDRAIVFARHADAVLEALSEAEGAFARGGETTGSALARAIDLWPQVSEARAGATAGETGRSAAWEMALLGSAPLLLALLVPPAQRAAWLERTLRPSIQAGRRRWDARLLPALSEAQLELGDVAASLRTARLAVAAASQVSGPAGGPAGGQKVAAHARVRVAAALVAQDNPRAAIDELGRAIEASRTAGDLRVEAEAHRLLGHARQLLGEPIAAAESYGAALACLKTRGAPYEALPLAEARAVALAQAPAGRAGIGAPAVEAYRQAALLASRLDDSETERRLARQLGDLCAADWPEESVSHYRRSLALSRAAGDEAGSIELLARLGATLAQLGRSEEAGRACEEALVLSRSAGDEEAELRALVGLSDALASQGSQQSAILAAQQALPLATRLGDSEAQLAMSLRLGAYYGDTGAHRDAIACLEDALRLSRELGQRSTELTVLLSLGRAHLAQGSSGIGEECLAAALPLSRALGLRATELDVLRRLGDLRHAHGDDARAGSAYDEAVEVSRALGDSAAERELLLQLADAQARSGRPDRAVHSCARRDHWSMRRTTRSRRWNSCSGWPTWSAAPGCPMTPWPTATRRCRSRARWAIRRPSWPRCCTWPPRTTACARPIPRSTPTATRWRSAVQ